MKSVETKFSKERESDNISSLLLKTLEKKIDLKMDEVPKNDSRGPSSINYY